MQPSKDANIFKTSKVRQKSSTMVNSTSLIFPTQQHLQLQPYKDTDKIPQAQGWKENSALLLQSLGQLGSAFQGSWPPGPSAPVSPHLPPPSPVHETKQSQKNNLGKIFSGEQEIFSRGQSNLKVFDFHCPSLINGTFFY